MTDSQSHYGPPPVPSGGLPRVAIVVSVYNRTVTDAMLDGAVAAYRERGGSVDHIEVFTVPGAFELPLVCAHACRDGRFGAVVALGCVLRGETDHDRYISHAVADQVARLSCDSGIPVGFGLLTVNTPEQALARSAGGDEPGGKGNKGRETMDAVLDTFETIASLRGGTPGANSAVGVARPGMPRDKVADEMSGRASGALGRSGSASRGTTSTENH